jgi:hypothetical protein
LHGGRAFVLTFGTICVCASAFGYYPHDVQMAYQMDPYTAIVENAFFVSDSLRITLSSK